MKARFLTTASVAALALLAGSAFSDAKADCKAGAMCVSAPASLAPAVFAAGLVGLGAYLIYNHKATGLQAKADPAYEAALANAAKWQPVPAYAFVETTQANYNLAAVPAK